MSKQEKPITRKEFIKRSCTGLTGLVAFNALTKSPLRLKSIKDAYPEKRVLGRTGIEITTVGYGASRSMEPSLLISAIDHGINWIDTGRSYFNGNNEIMVGNALKGIRKNVIIQSKMKIRPRIREKGEKLSAEIKKIMESLLNQSMKALQTDYIDMMLVHDVTNLDIIENETVMEILTTMKDKGRIRAHGFSCHNEIEFLKSANKTKFFDILMVPYNHKGAYVHMNSGSRLSWDQPAVEKELKKARTNNMGIICMKTCSGGPYSPGKDSKPSFPGAVKWVLDKEYVTTAAVAMGNITQIKENVQVMMP